MHNHILLLHSNLQNQLKIDGFIDEHPSKAGNFFWDLEISDPNKMDPELRSNSAVVICTRPTYLENVRNKLEKLGFDTFSLHPDPIQ